MITMAKEIEFDMAHRVPTHGSKCKHLHGHRYKVAAFCSAEDVIGEGEQSGMVMDFGFLKKIMMEKIHDVYDHRTMVYKNDNFLNVIEKGLDYYSDQPDTEDEYTEFQQEHAYLNASIKKVNFIPTAENLAKFFFELIEGDVKRESEGNAKLVMIRVYETPTSFAIYIPPKKKELGVYDPLEEVQQSVNNLRAVLKEVLDRR
jgi:6-pyruvoyltetrahydropterin/6-carboxytetrahydropterin synthase